MLLWPREPSTLVIDAGIGLASFSVRPMAVEGVFSVSEFKGPDGNHPAIYHIEGRRQNSHSH